MSQIITDDVTSIDLQVIVPAEPGVTSGERDYYFIVRGVGLPAPGESVPVVGDAPNFAIVSGDELTARAMLLRTLNAVQQAGTGLHPQAIRDLATHSLINVNDSNGALSYYASFICPSAESNIYFANR